MRKLIPTVIFLIALSVTSYGQTPTSYDKPVIPVTKPESKVVDLWVMDYENAIIGEWKLLDTIDFVDEVPHHYDVWNRNEIFVKEVLPQREGSPMAQLFYHTKINLHSGEFWARTYRVEWIKRHVDRKAILGGSTLRKN